MKKVTTRIVYGFKLDLPLNIVRFILHKNTFVLDQDKYIEVENKSGYIRYYICRDDLWEDLIIYEHQSEVIIGVCVYYVCEEKEVNDIDIAALMNVNRHLDDINEFISVNKFTCKDKEPAAWVLRY